MARLLADEHFPVSIVYRLRRLGHDVVTVREICENKAGDGLSDETVLSVGLTDNRAVLTENAKHFVPLHGTRTHAGIIICKLDYSEDPKPVARRIHTEIRELGGTLTGRLVRVPPKKP